MEFVKNTEIFTPETSCYISSRMAGLGVFEGTEEFESMKVLLEKILGLAEIYEYRYLLVDIKLHLSSVTAIRDILLNHPTNPLPINNYLKFLVQSYEFTEDYQSGDHTLISELINEAIFLGADVNFTLKGNDKLAYGGRLLDKAEYPLYELLKSHGAKCSQNSDRSADFLKEEIAPYLQDIFKFSEKLIENNAIETAAESKIPYIMHHVWVTHPNSPREIPDAQLEYTYNTHEIIKQSNANWSHIVWTNDRDLIPLSVAKLEAKGMEVRSIKEYKDELRLYQEIEQIIEQKLYGIASDALRYSIVERFGGVYSDLNFEFKRGVEPEMHKYDFFSQDFQNSFFAAKPSHPILTSIIDIVHKNIHNPPAYISSISEGDAMSKTIYMTLLPFTLGYLKSSNVDSVDTLVNMGIGCEDHWNISDDYSCPTYYTLFYGLPSNCGMASEEERSYNDAYDNIGVDQSGFSWM